MAGRRLAHGDPYGEGDLLNDVRTIPGLDVAGDSGRLLGSGALLSRMCHDVVMIQC
ncbi:hypothetical protein HMPREF9058_1299 [Actinomyces sp. oral taxon 175 str. F0384]|nr:hypothetical protein HMPREF9058_1299 [Actinomyces sp. oral taxon 175 str. F0384]